MKNVIFTVPIVCLLAACAGTDGPNQPRPRVWNDSDYVTGSNLPRRDKSMPADAQTISKQQIEEWQLPKPGPMPSGGGR
jgi:hypothetical protein